MEIWSTAAAHFASTAGWRYVMPKTSDPMRTRSVAWANAAMTAVASSTGVGRSESAVSPSPMKWSAKYTPSQPVASACWATSRVSDHGW